MFTFMNVLQAFMYSVCMHVRPNMYVYACVCMYVCVCLCERVAVRASADS